MDQGRFGRRPRSLPAFDAPRPRLGHQEGRVYTHDEIAPGIHQLRFYDAKRGIGFNQYLIAADDPALVSTGAMCVFYSLWV
jgi:hypothetical protein